MRIISGVARGRMIETSLGRNTRPTADRVKESVFSILQTRLPGARVLDLFAGSGALGLEALSRGAKNVLFVDASSACVALIQRNADKLGFSDCCEVLRGDYARILSRMQPKEAGFSLVFLDPPYDSGFYEPALQLLFGRKLMDKSSVAICEHDTKISIKDTELYAVYDRRRYGNTAVSLIRARSEGK